MVPLAGIEPARPCGHLILSQARLPIPPQGHGAGIIMAEPGGSTGKCGFRTVDTAVVSRYSDGWRFPATRIPAEEALANRRIARGLMRKEPDPCMACRR
jgi:hypothetical protein